MPKYQRAVAVALRALADEVAAGQTTVRPVLDLHVDEVLVMCGDRRDHADRIVAGLAGVVTDEEWTGMSGARYRDRTGHLLTMRVVVQTEVS